MVLQREGLVERVGIIDCDMHWGDGTSSIIDVLDAQGWVQHFSAGLDYCEPSRAADFFLRLEREVEAKSTYSVKPQFIPDVAIQVHVARAVH